MHLRGSSYYQLFRSLDLWVYSNKLVSLLIPVEHLGVLREVLHHLVLKQESSIVTLLLLFLACFCHTASCCLFRGTCGPAAASAKPCEELPRLANKESKDAPEPTEEAGKGASQVKWLGMCVIIE